jgi:hypothetical protein
LAVDTLKHDRHHPAQVLWTLRSDFVNHLPDDCPQLFVGQLGRQVALDDL